MRLRTFGGLTIDGDPSLPLFGPRRMGLLALVAAAGRKGISRDRVVGLLWPESVEDQARHTLSQTLHALKKETGRELISATPELRLDAAVTSDVGEFLEAVATGELAVAAGLYAGPFLEGFYLPAASEFERWVEAERARLHAIALRALEELATRADDAGRRPDALKWWYRLAELDPVSARYAAGLMRALAAAGDRSRALAHARVHEQAVRRELDADLDPAIVQLVAALRAPAALPASPTPVALPPAPSAPALPAVGAEPSVPAATAPAASQARPSWRRPGVLLGILLVVLVGLSVGIRSLWSGAGTQKPFLAVGTIRFPGNTDTTVSAGVLRDMLATSLGRIPGLRVVANSRLVELTPRGADTLSGASTDAARRAGATEIIEGEIQPGGGGLVLTLRRVALDNGVVRQGYEVRAADRYALVDSAAAAVARDLHVAPPAGAITDIRTSSPTAYALYEEGLRAYYQYDAAAAHRLMTAALERDSTFAMAAYFAWLTGRGIMDEAEASRALQRAKRLAPRATERERLLIEGSVATLEAPLARTVAIAETLTVRYPGDPDAQILLGQVRFAEGDWARSVAAFEQAVALDSIAGAIRGSYCRVCTALNAMSHTYLWWDSAGAAERSARRLIVLRPDDKDGWANLVEPLLRQGRRAEAEAAVERALALSSVLFSTRPNFDRDRIRWGHFEQLDPELRSDLRSPSRESRDEAHWLLVLSLRDQGRVREAHTFAEDPAHHGLLAMEMGSPGEAAGLFYERAMSAWHTASAPPAFKARVTTWMLTLAGTARAAAGDTAGVRRLADSVESLGALSSFGRDGTLHWVLRGLLLQSQGRHAEAVETFRRGMFTATDGYTLTNLLMARSLMVIGRPLEAIAILRPAIRGGVDGSNSYVSRTELHEALAQAFEMAGVRDSAAAHYRAVALAWSRADPPFLDRYNRAKALAGRR